MSRIKAKDGKQEAKEKQKKRKDLAKRLERLVLCKQVEDSGLAKARKRQRKRKRTRKRKGKKGGKGKKGKGKSKGKGKKGKEKRLERTVCRIVIKKDRGNECSNRHSVRNVEAEEQDQEQKPL